MGQVCINMNMEFKIYSILYFIVGSHNNTMHVVYSTIF